MSRENANNTTNATKEIEANLEALPQLIPIGVFIILTNCLVFVLYYSRRSLRKASNYLLLSLAVCDFFNGSINIPLFLWAFAVVPLQRTKYLPLICAVEVSHNLVAITAACHITLITAEKYIAITRPFKFHVIKKKTMLVALAGAWLISSLMAVAPAGWFSKRMGKIPIALTLEITYNVFCLLAVFVVPYTFIIYAHVAMFRKAFQKKSQFLCRNASRKICKKKKNELKCLVIFATMATVFLLCWLPWFVLRLIYSLVSKKLIIPDSKLLDTASQVILIARYLTSAINPLLYTFFKHDFWIALKRMGTHGKHPRSRSLSEGTDSRIRRQFTNKMRNGSDYSDSVEIPNTRSSKFSFRNQKRPQRV